MLQHQRIQAAARAVRARQGGGVYRSTYDPLPWHIPVLADTSPILLLTGSAGGGKSRVAGELTHRFMHTYKGATGLMLRKAREFAGKSIVPFMRHTVMKDDAAVEFKKGDRLFMYPGNSTLYYGGMKDDAQREALRSIGQDGALDFVWIEEANAFTIDDFEEIVTRMRGKAAPYTQIVLTTNPDAPNHWINQRLILGQQAAVYYSSANDNPYNPPEYREKLAMLTGTRALRLREGRWVQSEGAIYPDFSLEFNVSAQAEYLSHLPVTWGVDDGYAEGEGVGYASYHPRVVLFGQQTQQGGMAIFDEYYVTGELSERTLDYVLTQKVYARPEVAYIDSSAVEFKQRLWERDIYTAGATHRVAEGIKNVRRLVSDGQGIRLLTIHPRCVNLIREMQSYRYAPNSVSVDVGEPKPLKLDDHGPDALRYMTWHLRHGELS